MPRTVLHLIETGGPGGAEKMMVHLAAGLGSEYGSEAALIRDTWLGTALRTLGVPVTVLRYEPQGSFGNFRGLATVRDLVRVIRQRRIAVLHTHEFYMNTIGLIASKLTGIPIVTTVHGKNYYAERFRRRLAYRLVAKFSGQMIAVSEDIRRFLTEHVHIPPNRIRVIPNGVPVDGASSYEKVMLLRKDLDLDWSTRVIIAVGSLYPVKGHKYLIDAAAQVVCRYPQVVFLIVGRGRLRDELEAQARSLGLDAHVRFLGYREDVRDLLALSDTFVLPSLSEGMPLALLEAMAARVPPIATRVGGVSEVVEDGRTGLLVAPADSKLLAESIIKLLKDPTLARQMGRYARDVVARRFSLEKMVQSYQEVYTELIQRRNGRVET